MVKVDLNLLNIFVLRVKKNKIVYEGDIVGDIISQFLKEYKDLLDDSILSKNKKRLNPQMVILLNGRNISYMKNYKTKLSEGDQLYISFPISGG
ncbi:MAG: MoaD/ThiS family protein [Candidatus Lokiarchaeota archaeon]|nr:MoaD/ThiS family protein [Candidatus Lokiarchaeota archaeon]